MNKVIIINLNGRAYQLEEAGYTVLHHYLEQAAAKLGENLDKAEIMADFEQAIADKCDQLLNSHKTVVTTQEVEKIIQEMGPVDGAHATDSSNAEEKSQPQAEKSTNTQTPKRLYQICEGAVLSGVCNGLAVYFNIDVTLVRIIFIILTVLTNGAWILVYIIMSVVIPYANTSEQKAQAHGMPFNANELLQRAREKYGQFDKKYWDEQKQNWKEQAKKYSYNAKEYRQHWEEQWHKKSKNMPHTGIGIGGAILGIVMVLITFLWMIAIISLLTTGAIFGFIFVGIPIWLIIIFLTCAYNILLLPVRSMKSSSVRHNDYGQSNDGNGWFGILDAITWFTILALILWLVWTYVPQTHIITDQISMWLQHQHTLTQSLPQFTQQ